MSLFRPFQGFLAVSALLLALFAAPAQAAMVFCNRTDAPIEAALGYRESINWVSEGWWQIEPGQCARVFGKPLTQRFYFYYALSLSPPAPGKSPLSWTGKYAFCIDNKAFKVEGDGDCESRNYKTQGFQQVDIGAGARDYKLDFRNTP